MTHNNSMSITPSSPGQAKGERFEHGSVLGGKTRGARVSSQWKSTWSAHDGVSPGQGNDAEIVESAEWDFKALSNRGEPAMNFFSLVLRAHVNDRAALWNRPDPILSCCNCDRQLQSEQALAYASVAREHRDGAMRQQFG